MFQEVFVLQLYLLIIFQNILNTITVANVKEFLDKQKGRQVQDYRGYNSYVAPEALHEIQVDLATFTDSCPIIESVTNNVSLGLVKL